MGAREFLPLPEAEETAGEGSSLQVAQQTTVAEALTTPDRQSAPGPRIETDPHRVKGADEPLKPRFQDAPQPEAAPLDFNAWDLANLHPATLAGAKASEPRHPSDWETATKNENIRDAGRIRPAHTARFTGVESNSGSKSVPELFLKSEPTVPELTAKSTSWLDAMDNAAQTAARARPKIDRAALGPIFHAEPEEEKRPDHKSMYRVMLSAGLGLLVGLLFLLYMHPFGQAVAAGPGTDRGVPQAESDTAPPRAQKPVARRSATGAKSDVSSASGGKAGFSSAPQQTEQVSSEMMDAQLEAPTRISSEMKKPAPVEETAPPALSPGSMEVGGSVPNPDFSGGNRVKIEPAASAISAGVAEGMLIHKTALVYPAFARDNHLSGTVILGATISNTGTIQGAHVISGPGLFRSPAMEAVKNWRYRPYMLDNKPVAVETTIRVVFSLDAH